MRKNILTLLIFSSCFNPTGSEIPLPDNTISTSGEITTGSTSLPTTTNFTTSFTTSTTIDTSLDIVETLTSYSTTLFESTSTSTGEIIDSTTSFGSSSSGSDSTTEQTIPDKCGNRFIDLEEDCDWASYENTNNSLCIFPEIANDIDQACTLKILKMPLLYKNAQLVNTLDSQLNLEEGHIVCRLLYKNPNVIAKDYAVYDGVTPGYGVISNIEGPGSVLLKSHAIGYNGQPMYYYDPNKVPFNPQTGQSLYVPAGCTNI